MEQDIKRYLPVMTDRENDYDHRCVLLRRQEHSAVKRLKSDTIEIHVTPYIDDYTLRTASTKRSRWKLRQPFFADIDNINTDTILNRMQDLSHPYYKRVTIIDKQNRHVIKLYSTEHRKNYSIQYQGEQWANNIRYVNNRCDMFPKLLYYAGEIVPDIHAAVFEYIPGETLFDKYSYYDEKMDHGHPDVIAGNLDPYQAIISAVKIEHAAKVRSILLNMYVRLYKITKDIQKVEHINQMTANEPDWQDRWCVDDRRMINPDDWRLENIKQIDESYKFIKIDRTVVTDPVNATHRFIADLRNQTNLNFQYDRVLEKLT